MEEKNLWSIVSAVAITALIVGGAVYYSQKSKMDNLQKDIDGLKNQISTVKDASNNSAAVSPADITTEKQIMDKMAEESKKYPAAGDASDDTVLNIVKPWENSSGWTTYQNQEAEYSIDHLANWIVLRSGFPSGGCGQNCKYAEDLLIQNLPYVGFMGNGPAEGSVFGLRIFEISSPSNLTIRKWIETLDIPEADKQQRIRYIKTMNISGKNMEVIAGGTTPSWQEGLTFVQNNKVYDITYFSGSVEQFQKDLGTFEKMAESLIITTESEETSFEQYKNPKYNYLINYPKNWNVQKDGEAPSPDPPEGVSFSDPSNSLNGYSYVSVVTGNDPSQDEINDLKNSKGYQQSEITISGNIKAIKLMASDPNTSLVGAIYLSNGKNHFRISAHGETKVDIFNQMAESFKFIN
ncbi:MAG: hypothetical protein V1698_00910 [bacterium]